MITKFKKKSKFITAMIFVLTIILYMVAINVGAYAVQKIPSTPNSILPWKTMQNDKGQTYIYSQTGYYQEPYIFEMGWNLNEKGYNAYPNKAEIKLSDLTTIIVSFDNALQNDVRNQEILSALSELLGRLNDRSKDSYLALINPLVVSIKYIGDSELTKWAEEYYITNELTSFSAIFSSLDYKIQKDYVNRMFQDGQLAFFSANTKDIDAELINESAEKAYKENNLTFFSCIAPYLNEDEKEAWIARASHDKNNTFLSILIK